MYPPPPHNNNGPERGAVNTSGKAKKRFSLRFKLILIFGLLIALASTIEGLLAVRTARKAVTEKVETHLIDKATDVAEVIDGRVTAFWQFLEGIARMPAFRNPALSYTEKSRLLDNEAAFNQDILDLNIADRSGKLYTSDGKATDISHLAWYKGSNGGQRFFAEPFMSPVLHKLVMAVIIPVMDDNKNHISSLVALIPGNWLTDSIDDIVVGQTGYCYVLGLTGTTIATKDFRRVEEMENVEQQAKNDTSLRSLAEFEHMAVEIDDPSIDFYTYKGINKIASYATMKTTDWTVIVNAPKDEFMGTVNTLRLSMIGIGAIILVIALVVVYIVASAIVKPIQNAVPALHTIAQGDFTVQLPMSGNDEITDMADHFNQTIEKIGLSIKQVGVNSNIMEEIGSELASNMTETASSIHQISANIDGVKQQAMTQAASVTETAATIEEIVRTIKQLNTSIETQAASVAQSSSSVEEMVANIASITQTLEKTDSAIRSLTSATGDGKATLVTSNAVTHKIAEESGSLMEASSVIQHIASQTNLLAMNAAIEAAHAGEAGKGFAVVADEIRKLAEDSATQGKAITATLKTLSGEIETLSASSKTVEEKFNAIFSLAEQVKEMSARLTEAMREQENGSKEVLTAIKSINTVTVEVQAGSEEMLKGGEGVAKEMQKLDGLTRVITDSMNEMASGAVQINNAVQEVNELTQKNKRSIENLAQEVSKFKI